MADGSQLEDAFKRLDAAMEAFEAAVGNGREANSARTRLEGQLEALKNDRSDLARQLDEAKAKANGLKSANQDASARIDAVMDNIRTLLGNP